MDKAQAAEALSSLTGRFVPSGDLNEACIALEDACDGNPKNAANAFYALTMMMLNGGQMTAASQLEQQVIRFPDKAIERFKSDFGDDNRFSDLITAAQEALPALKALHAPEAASRGKDSSIGL